MSSYGERKRERERERDRQRQREYSGVSSYKGTNFIMRAPPSRSHLTASDPDYLPKAPSTNMTTVGNLGLQCKNLEGTQNSVHSGE